jgi:SAM-dependent methyltransferase
MLGEFRRHGWRAMGIERNEAAAAQARQVPGIEVVSTGIETLPHDAKFEIIVVFHALEHMSEPASTLRACAQRLTTNGRLIINVPNFASWQARFFGPTWMHLDVPRHVVHFTPATLVAALRRAGLELDAMSSISWEHDPYGWIESAVSRLTGRANTITRYLMGLDRFDGAVALAAGLAMLLAPPALALSLFSWLGGHGATMEIIAKLPKR